VNSAGPTGVRRVCARTEGVDIRTRLARHSRLSIFRGVPPRRTGKDTPAKLAARMRSWRVSLLRGRAPRSPPWRSFSSATSSEKDWR
jgi:hypothetical protein